jgi:hypothetical protein
MDQKGYEKLRSKVCLILAFSVLLSTTLNLGVRAQAIVLYVDPGLSFAEVGETFTVDIKIASVEFLYAWQLNMSFNPEVLRLVNVIEGDFLKSQPAGTIGAKYIEESWALFGWTTIGEYLGKSGSGTLATAEFEVLQIGESPIKIETDPNYLGLYVTFLRLQTSPNPPPVWTDLYPPEDFTVQNGYFNSFMGPMDAIQSLIETIDTWNLHIGTESSLKAKLKVAIRMWDMDKEGGAIRILAVFIDRVEMLRARTLIDEQADHLISEAQRIIDLVES